MKYLVDDEIVVDSDIVVKSNPIVDTDIIDGDRVSVDSDVVTPYAVIKEYIPIDIPPTVTPLQIVDYGSSSIECAFDVSTEQAEEVVKGVLCGTTNPPTFENADYRLLHGQGSMDLAFAGLHNNTEYYLRPYALSNLGYKYGDVVAQRTKANPIPAEYQLVEYLESSGTQVIDTFIIPDSNYLRIKGKIYYVNFLLYSQYRLGFGSYYNQKASITGYQPQAGNLSFEVGSSIGGLINNPINTETLYEFDLLAKDNFFTGFFGQREINVQYRGFIENSLTYCIFASKFQSYYGNMAMRFYNFFISNGNNERNMYPVYRKSDSKPGMYDIVNNIFYTNQGSGEFSVGPDKEFEEE